MKPRFLQSARVRLLVAVLCSSCAPTRAPPLDPEPALRARLGIPAEAKTVVIFGQAAHLDIDWQMTFEGYYQAYVENIFLQARGILDEQPRAFYSVAEMAFLKHHLEVHPEERDTLRAHAQRGALHVVGGGVTSPDTLLPETELIFRDLLYGTRFAEDTLGIRPRAAWLPDSFGHAATVPDLLAAAGFDSVGLSRLDGAPSILELIQAPPDGPPPAAGSSADLLRNTEQSNAFVWRGPGGGRVIAHWLSGLYCQGDDIDYENDLFQVPGGHLGKFNDAPEFTDAQISRYLARLQRLARTPYLFVPIGCDFQHPKEALVAYLDGYNQRQYPRSGVWAVAAPFDLYTELLAAHRADLPELERDLTPYFMGFYGTRPELKRATREAARPFFAAETFAVALGNSGATVAAAAAPAFERLTFSDHHDFITGTANDTVADTEQAPLLAQARAEGERAFAEVARQVAAQIPATPGAVGRLIAFNPSGSAPTVVLEATVPSSAVHALAGGSAVPMEALATDRVRLELEGLPPFGWRTVDLFPGAAPPPAQVTVQLLDAAGQAATGTAVERVVLHSALVRSQWDRVAGTFTLTSLTLDGVEALSGPSFQTTAFRDDGGLWRMGNEMAGCALTALASAPATEAVELREASRLSATVAFTSGTTVREVRLDAGQAAIHFALTARADEATSQTVSWRFATLAGAAHRTSLPGGVAERSVQHLFTPTWWPATEWASTGDWVLLLDQPTGVRFDADGLVELLTVRNAQREKCDIEGGTGTDGAAHRFEWVVTRAPTAAGAAQASAAYQRRVRLVDAAISAAPSSPLPLEHSLLSVEGDAVVTALKPAERGAGTIVRALLLPGPAVLHLGSELQNLSLSATDAVERDLEPLGAAGDTVTLDRERRGAIATVRLAP